jgi:hypothetical protein
MQQEKFVEVNLPILDVSKFNDNWITWNDLSVLYKTCLEFMLSSL